MSFKLQRVLILDLKSILPVNLDIIGIYFIQVQVTKIKNKKKDLKDNKKIYLQAFKSKKYKKKDFNFFSNPILEEEVIKLKNSFYIPIEIKRFPENDNDNDIDVYIVFKFLEEFGKEDFSSLKIDFNLVSNDIENDSILNSASYIIDYDNRVFAEYCPIHFYNFYFFELSVFFYSFIKEIKIYEKDKDNLKNQVSILKLKNSEKEIFNIKDISRIMEKDCFSLEIAKEMLEKSSNLINKFLKSQLDIFSEKIIINEPLKTMRIDNVFKNKNKSETFKKHVEMVHIDLNKTQINILNKIPNFLKLIQKSDENCDLLEIMKIIYKKKFHINLDASIISQKKKSFEICEEWYNKDILSEKNLKRKKMAIKDAYIEEQINSIEKCLEKIYQTKIKKKYKSGKHVFIFFHGFYGSIWDLQFVKFHIKLVNPEVIFYSVESIEDKTNGKLKRMFE